MGQDKKQLTKLLAFVKELYDDPDNKDFVAGIQAIVGQLVSNNSVDSEKIDEIYEYCLEKNARNQAEGLYDGFPLESIKDFLIEDYVCMERFRRKGDFLNFAAQLFLQIENISNAICNDSRFQKIYSNLIASNVPAYIQFGGKVQDRYIDKNNTTINKLFFGELELNKNCIDKKTIPLPKLEIFDRVKSSLYFAGYGACLNSSTRGEWNDKTNGIYDIYLIRCRADHRGSANSEKQEIRLSNILARPNRYYAIFFSDLVYFVNKITEGAFLTENLFKYSQSFVETNEKYIISSVLPSALFVRKEGFQPEYVPISAYGNSTRFEKGMVVTVTKKGGVITKIS